MDGTGGEGGGGGVNIRARREGARGKRPSALLAYVCAAAARADIVVVVHVDIENQFTLDRLENILLKRLIPVRRGRVDGSDFNALGLPVADGLLERLRVLEAEVPDVDVPGKIKCQLASEEKIGDVSKGRARGVCRDALWGR